MLKTVMLSFIFILGMTLLVLGFTVLRIEGANNNPIAVISGVIMLLGGTVGVCIYSKKARKFFEWFYDIVLSPFF